MLTRRKAIVGYEICIGGKIVALAQRGGTGWNYLSPDHEFWDAFPTVRELMTVAEDNYKNGFLK